LSFLLNPKFDRITPYGTLSDIAEANKRWQFFDQNPHRAGHSTALGPQRTRAVKREKKQDWIG